MGKNNNMTSMQQQKAAAKFAQDWACKGYEKGDTQRFWLELLQKVFEVGDPYKFIEFEDQVMVDSTNFMDGYIPSTKVLIEQKSIEKELGKPTKQSDGSWLNPFQQAKKYVVGLPLSRHPRWIVTCNFAEFWVYDMEQPNGEPQKIALKDLEKEYYRLSFLVDSGNAHLKREIEVSVKAGTLVGQIYDLLLKQYIDADEPETLRSLNVLCVRLVFCLYAEDAMLFGRKTAFHDYLAQYKAKDMRRALIDLFDVLDTPEAMRDPYMETALKAFPYVNGGLFSHDERLQIPQFTDELKDLILAKASCDFDWSEISPTIFGSVFESTLNPDTRRKGGMHYTSVENIHKVIDPLFFNALKEEFEAIKNIAQEKQRLLRFGAFQDKLANLTFLDPACGSGNFLTETYLSLRRLENKVILELTKGQSRLGFEETNPIKVNIHQFYGIEINDFAVSVATTALWIAENQMLKETESIVDFNIDMLPLKAYHNIKEGNALRLSWTEWSVEKERNVVIAGKANLYSLEDIPVGIAREPVARYGEVDLYSDEIKISPIKQQEETCHVDFDYIMGNPPFVGARLMSDEQKDDLISVFGKKWKNIGNMDYVCGWYLKTARLMQANTALRAALVSTNSITQGEQVAILWRPIFEQCGVHIDFAYRTFRWNSESSMKAHVHCVIIGFSCADVKDKTIYFNESQISNAKNINPYLIDAPDVFIESRKKPICDVKKMVFGSMPNDGGNLILSEETAADIIEKEPLAKKFVKLFIGAEEFINNKKRYCLWLKNSEPDELRKMRLVAERVEKVRKIRSESKRKATKILADTPWLFGEIRQPENGKYLLVPSTSLEKRRYIPMGFFSCDVISSNANLLIPDAGLYEFGVMNSNVHNAWMRVVCGRLKSDYRYSANIVYNNFPWCSPTDKQRKKIEQTAQSILDARNNHHQSSLADLYDETFMPADLRKAHQENDRAVMEAYGFDKKIISQDDEMLIVEELFKLYQEFTSNI
jgi:hypothetical protein